MDKAKPHRVGPGNRSMKLDPYALDDVTITLQEWRRLQSPPVRPPRTSPTTRRPAA